MIDLSRHARSRKPSPTMPDLNEFFTTAETAEKLNLTIRAVNRLVASRKLEGIKIGRMYLITRVSVKTYLDNTKDMSKNDPRRKAITK